MYLQDFIAERNIKQSAVSMYLKRHEDDFNGHTSMRDGKLWLDDVAINLLSKKYPILPVDEIWTPLAKRKYEELAEELRETNKEIRQLNAEKRELQQYELKYRALESEQRLLIEAAVDEKNKEIGILEGFVADAKAEIQQLQNEKQDLEQKKRDDEKVLKEHYEQEIKKISEELEVERSRKWKFPWMK